MFAVPNVPNVRIQAVRQLPYFHQCSPVKLTVAGIASTYCVMGWDHGRHLSVVLTSSRRSPAYQLVPISGHRPSPGPSSRLHSWLFHVPRYEHTRKLWFIVAMVALNYKLQTSTDLWRNDWWLLGSAVCARTPPVDASHSGDACTTFTSTNLISSWFHTNPVTNTWPLSCTKRKQPLSAVVNHSLAFFDHHKPLTSTIIHP